MMINVAGKLIDIEESVGIDEVGRGPLAGPVVSAAVWISDELVAQIENDKPVIRDSKKMTPNQRAKTIRWIDSQPFSTIRYSIGCASVEEIDQMNILQATLLSMKRAYEALNMRVKYALIDGNAVPVGMNVDEAIPVIKGDANLLTISLASIIAKECRDSFMQKLALDFPVYGWDTNVGYGSQAHINAILQYGITEHHRKSFAPIKDMIQPTVSQLYNS